MAKCISCHKGLNSSYIRINSNGSLWKIGFYCNTCNLHYNLDQKLYTVNEKLYTVSNNLQNGEKESSPTNISANLPTIPHNHENSTILNHNKLYNCQQDIHQKKNRRVRSVVRISRRSSEPQVMGSKPTGPVNHMGSNNSWLYNGLDKRRRYNIAR